MGVLFGSVLLVGTVACAGKGVDTAVEDDPKDTSHPDDTADTADTGGALPNDYTTFEGWEIYTYAWAEPSAGETACSLRWETVGTPWPTLCEGCEFVFDVDLTLVAEDVVDDGSCAAMGHTTDFKYTYAFTRQYFGYGEAWLYLYDGEFIWFGDARFDKGTFTYWWGYSDYYYAGDYGAYPQYAGLYFTNYSLGQAAVR